MLTRSSRFRTALAAKLLLISLAGLAQAVMIGGVEFTQGAISFADAVVDYAPHIAGDNPTSTMLLRGRRQA